MATNWAAKFATVSPYVPPQDALVEVDRDFSSTPDNDVIDSVDSVDNLNPDAVVDIIEWRALGLQPEAITRMSAYSLETINEIIEAWPELWECASEDAFNRLLHKMYSLAVGRETPKSGQLSYLQSMLGYLGGLMGIEDTSSSIINTSDEDESTL